MRLFFRLFVCSSLLGILACSPEGISVVAPASSHPSDAIQNDGIPLVPFHPGGWARLVQTAGTEWVAAVAVDREGDVVVAGQTSGAFYTFSNAGIGTYDLFVIKYNLSSGKLLWIRQLGTSESDLVSGLHITADNGIVLTGVTYGAWQGGVHKGGADAFVMKMSSSGTLLWVQQTGTEQLEDVGGVVSDQEGALYVAGSTQGTFAENVSSGEQDLFLWKLSAEGKPLWLQQFGTSAEDRLQAIAFHSQTGRIFVGGMTKGAWPLQTNQGGQDAWVASLHTDGSFAWQTQLGGLWDDRIQTLVCDSAGGGVFFGGSSRGNWTMQTSHGGVDGLLGHLDAGGRLSWVRLVGGGKNDEITTMFIEDSKIWFGGNTRSYVQGIQSFFVALATLQGEISTFASVQSAADGRMTSLVAYKNAFLIGGGTFGALDENAPNAGQEDGLILVHPQAELVGSP